MVQRLIAGGLKHCNNLQTLDLGWNSIALGKGISTCRPYWNPDGAKALADGLKHCNNLQTLDLEGNNIGLDGAKALADGLKHCNNLKTLILVHNEKYLLC